MSNLEAALKYLSKGWPIIPINPTTKKPCLETWKEFQNRLPTEEEVRGWWTKWPWASIGLVTGKLSGISAIDVDPRHGGTEDGLPETVKSQTGGGGSHHFYQYDPSVYSQNGLTQGIDLKSDGGYVILPPSEHKSGNKYKWIIPPFVNEFKPLPQWVIDSQQVKKTSAFDPLLLQGVSEGKRNESAASVIGKILHGLKEQDWQTIGWQTVTGWNLKNKPPLKEDELRNVFQSIANKEKTSRENKDNSQASGTETPSSSVKQKLIEQQLTYTEVEDKVKKLLPNSQTALKLVLAVAASSSFPNPLMIWLLLVGVPSSGKTDLVRLIKDADTTYYLDNLTQNAFISGERASKSNKVYDLLPLLDKKCLVIKDWTSIFSLDEKMTKKLLGDLVGIYDKEFTKFSSRRGNIGYVSAFSQLGCITPATLNRHTSYMNMVGPRFLCYTMPSSTLETEDQSYEQIFSNQDRSLIEKEARLYVSSYLPQLVQKTPDKKPLSKEVQEYLKTAAKLMSNCRGIVLLQAASFKSEDGEDVKYYEVLDVQIEQPWRAIQQLITLAKYLAFVVGKNEVGVNELAIIKEIVLSSMPADRSQALRIVKDRDGNITAKGLTESFDRSIKTSRRLLDELVALKVLEKIKGSGTIASDYKIYAHFQDFLLLDPTEFMSHKEDRGTETPHSIDQGQFTPNFEQQELSSDLPDEVKEILAR